MRFLRNCKIPLWIPGLLTGFLFLGLGFVQGQFAVIFQKAVIICLECIGIG